MGDKLEKIRAALANLSGEVRASRFERATRAWGGADVVITTRPTTPRDSESFYPPPRNVVTPSALELSWLFERLRDIFSPVLDGTSKIEFYGRLANAANRYLAKVDVVVQNPQDLLLAVAHEAHSILDEMKEGDFRFLPLAVGNSIFDDLVDEAERSGYIGVEATRQFFEDMERKNRDA